MKTLSFLLAFPVLILSAKTEGTKVTPESRIRYEVVKTSPDKTLLRTEAAFDFVFVTRDGKPVTAPITYSINGKQQKTKASKTGKYSLKVKPGKHKCQFFYNNTHSEVYTDSITAKAANRTQVKVYFDRSDIRVVEDKPVIYLYPEKTTEVQVQLAIKGNFLYTYPTYNNGWTVTADPDGNLHQGDKTFGYLFWEGQSLLASNTVSSEAGFVRNRNELTAFFEEKLSHLGLNTKEQQDFITYWVPRMQAHSKHLIRFVLNEDYNKTAAISVSPQPDTMIRVFMLWTPLEKNQEIILKEPALPTLQRKGFTLVEWGGAQVNIEQL